MGLRRRRITQEKFDAVKREARDQNGRRRKMYELFTEMHEGSSSASEAAEKEFIELFASPAKAKKVYDQLMNGEVDREGL